MRSRLLLAGVCSLCCGLAGVTPAAAAGAHKARVSADLADHLQAGSQTIRVIAHGTRAEVDAIAARYSLRILRYLQSGAVFLVNAGQLEAMRDDEAVDHLSGDIQIRSSVDAATIEGLGVDQVWAGTEEVPALSGKSVTVAVIDSGIDTRHNALRKRVLYTKDFTGGDGLDHYGHGTHVAAIIAGQAGRTAETKDYRGIAPGAYLLNLRVLGEDGSGTVSDVVEAIDWAVEHEHEYNVRVINLSLGAPVLQPYRDDPLCEAVERAVKAGITVVVAAGNYGKTVDGRTVYGGITSPANSPYAIAVGALDTQGTAKRSDDVRASYSSMGPTRYDLIVKPDLAAPGSHIASAEATDSYLSKMHPERHVTGAGANAVMQLSGTSMAAGVVSGAAALLLEERPNFKPRDTSIVLQITSSFISSAGVLGSGAGAINAISAVEFASDPSTSPATLIGGELQRPSCLLIVQGTERVHHLHHGANSAQGLRAASGKSIIWGSNGDSIIWGSSITWGSSIIWGSNGDSIIWGSNGDSITWGSNGDSIIWGSNDLQ